MPPPFTPPPPPFALTYQSPPQLVVKQFLGAGGILHMSLLRVTNMFVHGGTALREHVHFFSPVMQWIGLRLMCIAASYRRQLLKGFRKDFRMPVWLFSRFQLSSIQVHHTQESPYILHPICQKFPQFCLWYSCILLNWIGDPQNWADSRTLIHTGLFVLTFVT